MSTTGKSVYEQEVFKEETSDISSDDPVLMRTQIISKITPMIDGYYDTEFEWLYKFARLPKATNKIDINDILQLVLHRGQLKPGEIQFVHVIFRPTYNVNVRAVLECEVLGGPPETVIVTGQSCDLRYAISAETINFKIRSFHEHAIEVLKICNTALLPFEFKTYLNEPVYENELNGVILELLPPEKTLEPEEEIEMKIVMRPGVVGHFHTVFLLEIGHLPHIPIEVFGWGVIPQIYLTLAKPAAEKVSLYFPQYLVEIFRRNFLIIITVLL